MKRYEQCNGKPWTEVALERTKAEQRESRRDGSNSWGFTVHGNNNEKVSVFKSGLGKTGPGSQITTVKHEKCGNDKWRTTCSSTFTQSK